MSCLTALLFVATAGSDEPVKQLLAEHVPASVLAGPSEQTNAVNQSGIVGTVDGEMAVRSIREPSRERTAGDRWEKFESEFGIRQKDPSFVKSSMESAKYSLDKSVFALNEFVQNVEGRLSFDYPLRSLGRPATPNNSSRPTSNSPIPLWDAVGNAHFKSDIDLDAGRGRAFVGVRLVLPIGD
jgi:hypothetical protein